VIFIQFTKEIKFVEKCNCHLWRELNYAYNNNVDLGFVFWLYFLAERLSVFKK